MRSRSWLLLSLTAGVLATALLIYRSRETRSDDSGSSWFDDSNASATSLSSPPASRTKARVASRSSAVAADDQWQQRWLAANELADKSLRTRERAALLEELATRDPRRAIDLAQSEENPDVREELLQAAARGWGKGNADVAAEWALSQSLLDQGLALASVFHGAANDPDDALRLAARLSEQDPDRKHDYGSYLIHALGRAGDFEKAAAFAADGAAEHRTDWLSAAYSRWADDQPQAALKHVAQLSDPDLKRTAFDATISRWAGKEPEAAVKYAMALPPGREQTFAMMVSLQEWATADTPAAAAWLSRFEPSASTDYGAAVIASHPDALREPHVATSWAESIVNSELRVRVLATLVKEWSTIDPVASRQYAETSPSISAEDRPGVLAAFQPDFNPLSLSP